MRGSGLRSRWPRWPSACAVIGVIIAGGAVVIAKWPHHALWLSIVAAAAAVMTTPALAALTQAVRQRQEIGRAARAALQATAGPDGRKLPAAGTADLEARVHQRILPIPYIRRDAEETIRAHLHAGRPVLLIGSSMAGKTKMAAHVIAEEFGSLPVVIPDGKTALADLDAKDVRLQGSVIWLDDIDRLIGAGGITDGALRRLAAAGNIIAATIGARGYDQFRPSDQLRLPEWDVLSVFEPVYINRNLSPVEEERLAAAVSDLDIRDRIRAVGIGEYVGAASQVAGALNLGAAGTDPLGYALVLAAADWRRCGMTRPVPSAVLKALAKPHLDQRGQARLADRDAFNMALSWATREINSNVALLQTTAAGCYSVYDYALDLITARGMPISDRAWAVVIAMARIPELVSIGHTAKETHHRNEIAAQAWRRAADSEDAEAAPLAAAYLGLLLSEQGDVQGARDAYQKAIDSGHSDGAPIIAKILGDLLEREGNAQGARGAYQKAIDSGHPGAAPSAAVGLGNLRAEQGDVQGARDAYQQAIDSGHPDAGPRAVLELGSLLAREGDVQGARDAYQQAIDSGHPDAAPLAAAIYADSLSKEPGDAQVGKDAWRKAIDPGHAATSPLGALGLGSLLAREGDVQGARDAYQKAIDSGDPDAAPLAAVGLGSLLAERGDVQGARDAYQKATDSGHAVAVPGASLALGCLLMEQGDVQGAMAAYRKAINSDFSDAASLAAVCLGSLLAERGDAQGAMDVYRVAVDSGHADAAPVAAGKLGHLLLAQGDGQGAKAAYQQAVDSGHAAAVPEAALCLGMLLAREGDAQRC